MPSTFAEKMLAHGAGLEEAHVGEIVDVEPDFVMSHDNAAAISKTFAKFGVDKVWNPNKIVIPIDHVVPAAGEKHAQNHKTIREFVAKQGINNFYDINTGICHQVLPEKGYAAPGRLILGSDSHTTTYGAFGAFSAGIGRTEVAAIWATGKLWLRVPETFRININGQLPKGVYPKDLALHIIGKIRADGADYKSVEYGGEAISNMSISGRMTMCNLAAEMGAKNGVVMPDKRTEEYLRPRVKGDYTPVFSDPDAQIWKEQEFEADDVVPTVAFPHTVDNTRTIDQALGIQIDEFLLGTCTNGRLDDLQIAANILKGKKVAKGSRMLVFPASMDIYLQAMKDGTLATLIEAGAIVMNPGCGPCLGAHEGVLAPGEKALSTANRNFKGRMGCKEAEVYLASPATIAASAIKGEIVDPRDIKEVA